MVPDIYNPCPRGLASLRVVYDNRKCDEHSLQGDLQPPDLKGLELGIPKRIGYVVPVKLSTRGRGPHGNPSFMEKLKV